MVAAIILKTVYQENQLDLRSSLTLSTNRIMITINNVRESTKLEKPKLQIMKHIRNGQLKKDCETIQKQNRSLKSPKRLYEINVISQHLEQIQLRLCCPGLIILADPKSQSTTLWSAVSIRMFAGFMSLWQMDFEWI